MALEFGRMKHGEIRQAAELATRAFDDYEYFTNWFPDKGKHCCAPTLEKVAKTLFSEPI